MYPVRADVQQLRDRVLLLEAREQALTTLLQTKSLLTPDDVFLLGQAVESQLRRAAQDRESPRIRVRPRLLAPAT